MNDTENLEKNIDTSNVVKLTQEEKKLRTETVPLPSGAWVELRGMKTQEMDILANRSKMKEGEGINEIAKNCIISCSEGFDYDTALQGDRFLIIIAIRRITYKGPYVIEIECPTCGEKHSYNIKLDELKVTMLNGRATKNLEFEFPICGKKIKYHLATGVDEAELLKVRKQYPENILSLSIMVSTDSVEGMPFKDIEFFKNLDAEDVMAFQEQMDETSCGVETVLDITCGNKQCGEEIEVELPITKDFFLPKKAKKR